MSSFRTCLRRALPTTVRRSNDLGAAKQQAGANTGMTHMIRSTSTATLAICSLFASFTPLLAASPPTAPALSRPSAVAGAEGASAHPAEKCLGDVKAFNDNMSKSGYWLGGSGYGYGYPMGGYGYGYVPLGSMPPGNAAGYGSARPGYEIRTLIASATVLARLGHEQECQTVLATARPIYTRYETDLHARGIHSADMPGWRQRQIAAAAPVVGADASFRSDQLLDTDVVSPGNETLGSVHDLVLNPHTGKIAYLIISRGGLFWHRRLVRSGALGRDQGGSERKPARARYDKGGDERSAAGERPPVFRQRAIRPGKPEGGCLLGIAGQDPRVKRLTISVWSGGPDGTGPPGLPAGLNRRHATELWKRNQRHAPFHHEPGAPIRPADLHWVVHLRDGGQDPSGVRARGRLYARPFSEGQGTGPRTVDSVLPGNGKSGFAHPGHRDTQAQDVISRDNVSMKVDAVLYFNVVNPGAGYHSGSGLSSGDEHARSNDPARRVGTA